MRLWGGPFCRSLLYPASAGSLGLHFLFDFIVSGVG